jgi:hypothetical protein
VVEVVVVVVVVVVVEGVVVVVVASPSPLSNASFVNTNVFPVFLNKS